MSMINKLESHRYSMMSMSALIGGRACGRPLAPSNTVHVRRAGQYFFTRRKGRKAPSGVRPPSLLNVMIGLIRVSKQPGD